MSDQIKEAIEAQGRAFEEFKRVNDQKIEAVKSDKGVAELTAKLDTMFTAMQEQKRVIEEIEAKAKRPNLGGTAGDADENVRLHKEGFSGFMRKGKESGLIELEQKALGISTNSGADGGYAVPKVIDSMIEDFLINISPVRSVANVVQIGTSDYHKLVNLRGTASGWVGEVDARGATGTPTLKDVTPPLGELYANPQATQQMLDDVFFNVESWLAMEVATEFARAEGAAFIVGTGVNMPKGFTAYTTVAAGDATRAFGSLQYVPTGVAGAFAASSPADILFNTVSTLKAGYRQGASWMMNKATLFQIAQFKDSTGRYIFNPVSAPGVPQQLLNYNLNEAEDMPGIGANALGIAFGDFKRGYEITDRIGTRVLRDPFSNKPYIGFYTTKRVGGGVINSEAIKFVKFAVS
jgi:HK97 family phage major capsid protein